MNITEEAEKRYGKPEDAENDVQVALSLGFKTGAEWARKEALEEAVEVAKAWGRANEEGGYARSAFTVARKIRALAEGTPDGQR